MNKKTVERLEKVGWSIDRKIDVSHIIGIFSQRGFELSEKNISFLEQFGMLEFELENNSGLFNNAIHKNFNPIKAIGKNMYKYSLEYLEDEYSEIENIETVIPIGENENGNMLILCTNDNQFYGYTDGCLIKYGDTIDDMLDCIIGEIRLPEYID